MTKPRVLIANPLRDTRVPVFPVAAVHVDPFLLAEIPEVSWRQLHEGLDTAKKELKRLQGGAARAPSAPCALPTPPALTFLFPPSASLRRRRRLWMSPPAAWCGLCPSHD